MSMVLGGLPLSAMLALGAAAPGRRADGPRG